MDSILAQYPVLLFAYVGVSVGSAEGEAVADGAKAGSGVPQAAASKASMVNRKESFFIRWILLLFA